MYDVIIIGGGTTGFSAAMYTGRLNLKTLVIAESIGGTLAIAGSVENWPGIKKIDGFELAMQVKDHAMEYGCTLVEERVEKIEKISNGFVAVTAKNKYEGKTVIVATGTKIKKLGVPGEDTFANKGVHYCALCDGAFYKNKIIGVVGGSDSAAKEALVLAEYGSRVYIIYRKENIRAEPVNLERVMKNKKIEIIQNTNVLSIQGDTVMTEVILDKAYKGHKTMKIDGLFIEIGHLPLSEIVKGVGVAVNAKGEIIINRNAETNVTGVFAAGDVVDTSFKQAITGAGEAVLAAYAAYQYVSKQSL